VNKTESYEEVMINMSPKQWPTFLMDNAFVSGKELNIELAETFARVGTLMDFKRFVRIDHIQSDERSAEVFLIYCGILGYGVYLSKYYDQGLLDQLREQANDPRITIRQAVIKALRYIGRKDFQRLINYVDDWKAGTALEQWTCLAAVCSPELLKDQEDMLKALELLEWITATFVESLNWNHDYKLLQDEVARCWAKIVAENPAKGKQKMERWMKEQHPMVKTIMKNSLLKDSLQAQEKEWANEWLGKI